MRDSFLSVLAPELVQLPAARVTEIAQRARSLGNRTVVRVMEVLGSTLVEMRHAPDARLLLEVAMVQLSSPDSDDSTAALTSRIAALEERVAQLVAGGISTLPPAPVDSSTGRAKLGGRASGARDSASPSAAVPRPAATTDSPGAGVPAEPAAAGAPSGDTPPSEHPGADPAQVWPQVVDSLKPLAKAIFRPATVDSVSDNVVTVRLPHNTPLDKGQQHVAVLTQAIRKLCGARYSVVIVKDDTDAVPRAVEDKPVTIADEVAADEFKPIDPDDILPGVVTIDQSVETLRDFFPGGHVEAAPGASGKKK